MIINNHLRLLALPKSDHISPPCGSPAKELCISGFSAKELTQNCILKRHMPLMIVGM